MAESEELKSLSMKVKEESGKDGLKLNIQKTKIITSGPITSWEIDGETVGTVASLFFGAPKSLQIVTAANSTLGTKVVVAVFLESVHWNISINPNSIFVFEEWFSLYKTFFIL